MAQTYGYQSYVVNHLRIKTLNNQPQKVEISINDRIKFLISALNMSARAFSHTLEVSESTTRNYLDKGSKPSVDYIERIAIHFTQVDVVWMVTGRGEPFLVDSSTPTKANESNAIYTATHKNFSHSQVTTGKGNKASQQQGQGAGELAALQREIEYLKAQLASANALVAAKDETIQLLKAATQK